MTTPTQACWYIVGRDSDTPYVIVDLHDARGAVCRSWSARIFRLPSLMLNAHLRAHAYAARYDLADALTYDDDSSAFFAEA